MQPANSAATAPFASALPPVTDTAMTGCIKDMVATVEDISMFAELRVSSPTKRRDSFIVAGRGIASPPHRRHNSTGSPGVAMKLHYMYRHHIARSSTKNVALREARSRLKHDVESNHVDSPALWVRGELCIPAGPLPSFVDAATLEDALHDLPDGSRLSCIMCVSAWRMGHLDAKSLREYLRSVAWQSAALQGYLDQGATPPALSRQSSAETETSEEACELLSEDEMRAMMCGAG